MNSGATTHKTDPLLASSVNQEDEQAENQKEAINTQNTKLKYTSESASCFIKKCSIFDLKQSKPLVDSIRSIADGFQGTDTIRVKEKLETQTCEEVANQIGK